MPRKSPSRQCDRSSISQRPSSRDPAAPPSPPRHHDGAAPPPHPLRSSPQGGAAPQPERLGLHRRRRRDRDHAAAQPHGARLRSHSAAHAARRRKVDGRSIELRPQLRLPVFWRRSARWRCSAPGGGHRRARAPAVRDAQLLSSVCLPELEEVAAASNGAQGLSALRPRRRRLGRGPRRRAIAAGYTASASPSTPRSTAGASATLPSAS